MTIGSLFSGIGGLELGLEMAGLGPVVWQVERDPFCLSVLARHWPSVERFDDVTTVGGANLAPVGLVCGGFPCQDISSSGVAGDRAGLAGSRSGLWREFARIVGELRPGWVVVENVASGANLWVDAVGQALVGLGYAVLPLPLSASDVGALHRRARVFIVAHAYRDRKPAVAVDAEVAEPSASSADAHSQPLRLDEQRIAARRADRVRDEGDAFARYPSWSGGRFPEPDMVRMVHGVPGGLGHRSRRQRRREAPLGKRRSALGNSVVPQCAEVVGWVIRELMKESAA